MRRVLLFLPVLAFAALTVFALFGLRINTSVLPSALIDQPMPAFDLPAVSEEIPPLASRDLVGDVVLINIFGSWCVACQYEHDFLMDLKRRNVINVYGIDWKDTPAQGAAWLERYGNPYTAVGNDQSGRTAIAFGVTGAPETFIIDKKGRIRWRHVGPLTPEEWQKTLWPLIEDLRKEAA
jgi:cytochrome c biogenesis protein CcmG/thiol:disulfide interchange protein DsbE